MIFDIGDHVKHKTTGWTGTLLRPSREIYHGEFTWDVEPDIPDATVEFYRWFESNLEHEPLCDVVPPQFFIDGKEINPKQVVGSTKTPLDYLEPYALEEISHVMKHGADKYGRENYRQTEILLSIYVGAVMRHLGALRSGEAVDPDTARSHWAHIGACAMVCLAAMDAGTYTEDVPYISDLPVETGVWKNTGFEPLEEDDDDLNRDVYYDLLDR